jgi:hypothetical protein
MKGNEKKNPKKKDRERKMIKNFKNMIFGGQSRLEIAPRLGLRYLRNNPFEDPKGRNTKQKSFIVKQTSSLT